VHFVDDVDLETRPARAHVDVRAQLPNLVDAAVAGAVDFQDVDVVPARDTDTGVALATRLCRRAVDVLPTPRAPVKR